MGFSAANQWATGDTVMYEVHTFVMLRDLEVLCPVLDLSCWLLFESVARHTVA